MTPVADDGRVASNKAERVSLGLNGRYWADGRNEHESDFGTTMNSPNTGYRTPQSSATTYRTSTVSRLSAPKARRPNREAKRSAILKLQRSKNSTKRSTIQKTRLATGDAGTSDTEEEEIEDEEEEESNKDLICPVEFEAIVRSIVRSSCNEEKKFEKDALEALRAVAEEYLTNAVKAAHFMAVTVGGRKSTTQRDFAAVRFALEMLGNSRFGEETSRKTT